MSNPLWPAGLPQSPLVGSVSMMDQDARLVFQPDVGPPMVRQRYTTSSRALGFQMIMNSAQLAILDVFFKSTLKMGALKFDWIDPSTAAPATFTFDKPYQINGLRSQDAWAVSINLIRSPQ